MSGRRFTEADVQLLVTLIKSAAVTAAKFKADRAYQYSAMLGGLEAVLGTAVEMAGGEKARDAIDAALRYVPTDEEVAARRAGSPA